MTRTEPEGAGTLSLLEQLQKSFRAAHPSEAENAPTEVRLPDGYIRRSPVQPCRVPPGYIRRQRLLALAVCAAVLVLILLGIVLWKTLPLDKLKSFLP